MVKLTIRVFRAFGAEAAHWRGGPGRAFLKLALVLIITSSSTSNAQTPARSSAPARHSKHRPSTGEVADFFNPGDDGPPQTRSSHMIPRPIKSLTPGTTGEYTWGSFHELSGGRFRGFDREKQARRSRSPPARVGQVGLLEYRLKGDPLLATIRSAGAPLFFGRKPRCQPGLARI